MPNQYQPKPLDLSNVVIDDDLLPLIEEIAKNVHEVWAEQRLKEGWVYGKERNDKLKTTPCLVPYDELPEIEKEYDRRTAISSIKLAIKLGFKITKATK